MVEVPSDGLGEVICDWFPQARPGGEARLAETVRAHLFDIYHCTVVIRIQHHLGRSAATLKPQQFQQSNH